MMNTQQSLERESQESHFLGQVYQGGTLNFWGLECLESGLTNVSLKNIKSNHVLVNLLTSILYLPSYPQDGWCVKW